MRGRLMAALLCALLAGRPARAQTPPPVEVDLDLFFQQLFDQPQTDADYADLYETLYQYYRAPLDLNRADRDALLALYLLTPAQVEALLDYRQTHGALLSLYELQAVPGLDLPTLRRLLPFVRVGSGLRGADPRPLRARLTDADQHYLLLRSRRTLEQAQGYLPPDTTTAGNPAVRFAGSPQQLYARYRIARTGDYSAGFTAEKDAGEPFGWRPTQRRYGFDFLSAHLMVENRGRLRRLVVGDFQLQIGQGLLLAAGFGLGKGAAAVTTVRRPQLGIRPYTSVLETTFFRGVAATVEVAPGWELTAFGSAKRVDGTVREDSTADQEAILATVSAFNVSGLHRTPTERARRGQVKERVVGGDFTYQRPGGRWRVGLTTVRTAYNLPLQRTDRIYNRFDFNAAANLNLGAHASATWRNVNGFGEVARAWGGGWGGVAGVLMSLAPNLDAALVVRRYGRDFTTLYGAAFGERTRNQNEQGIYWGLTLRPLPRVEVNAFFDRYRFPWLSYLADAPVRGQEFLLRLHYAPDRQTRLYAQLRRETRQRNEPGNITPLDYLTDQTRTNALLHFETTPATGWQYRTRLQGGSYRRGAGRSVGYVLAQDLGWRADRWRLSGRVALFDTDDYDTRQYLYEQNVLYAFSFPVLAGRGVRTYLLAQCRLGRSTDVWLRYARTHYRDRPTVGNGADRTDGPRRTEVTAQLRQRF